MKKIIIALILIITFSTACYNKDLNQEPAKATISDQTIDGLKISGFNIENIDNISYISANVENTNASEYHLKEIKINLYDKNNTLIVSTAGYIGESIPTNDYRQISTGVTMELNDVTRVEYTIIKE